jgi:hypothetical protein
MNAKEGYMLKSEAFWGVQQLVAGNQILPDVYPAMSLPAARRRPSEGRHSIARM